ncbi:prenylated flavin chaperone LpdD [Paenibacillus sp. CAU 1782]
MSLIEIQTVFMGKDIAFLITGGDAHIGASATAYWNREGEVVSTIQQLPGHREGELAEELAVMAASRLGVTVNVLAGIHVESPTREEIADIVEETRLKMAEAIRTAANNAAEAENGAVQKADPRI